MIVLFPVLIMLVGLLIYVLSRPENGKAGEVGRIMFAFGLLATLLQWGQMSVFFTR